MKYLLVIAQETEDGITQAVYAYDTLAAATSAWHAELASGYASSAMIRDMAMVIDSDGCTYKMERIDGGAAQ